MATDNVIMSLIFWMHTLQNVEVNTDVDIDFAAIGERGGGANERLERNHQ